MAKSYLKILMGAFCIASLMSCKLSSGLNRTCELVKGEQYCTVSMVSLLADPSKYDNKRIIVSGYYKSAMEMSALFLTKDHADIEDFSNAVWVSYNKASRLSLVSSEDPYWKAWFDKLVDSTSASHQYVQIAGIYKAGQAGHFGVYQGEMSDVPGFDIKSTSN